MAETNTERALRLKEEREAQKAREKKMTTRQAAAAMLHRHLAAFDINEGNLAIFLRKKRVTDKKAAAAKAHADKIMAKFLERIAKVAGEENI